MKQITEFPNYYGTEEGNILNSKGKTLAAGQDQKGYNMVCLRKDGKSYTKRVARLIASLFIENPLCKSQINHKNGIRWDDRVENLEWNTGSENILHAYNTLKRKGSQTGRRGELSPFSKKVIQMDLQENIIKVWGSLTDAANFFNIKRQTITSCIIGRSKTAAKFKWKFYE